MLDLCNYYRVPCLLSEKPTSDTMAEVIRWLKAELAPRISIHGVLVDVFGEGVLIMGESGIGKSEAALELIKRGHRLVSDDVVEIRKVSDVTLVGTRAGDHQVSDRAAGNRHYRREDPVRRGERKGYPVHRYGDQAGGMG